MFNCLILKDILKPLSLISGYIRFCCHQGKTGHLNMNWWWLVIPQEFYSGCLDRSLNVKDKSPENITLELISQFLIEIAIVRRTSWTLQSAFWFFWCVNRQTSANVTLWDLFHDASSCSVCFRHGYSKRDWSSFVRSENFTYC